MKLFVRLALVAIGLALAVPVNAAVHYLPVANFDNYQSALIANNPSGEAIGEPCINPQCFFFYFSAYSTTRLPVLDRDGVRSYELPDGLDVYMEIRDPLNQIILVRDLGPATLERVQFMDLARPGFVSYLFLWSDEPASLTVSFFNRGIETGFASIDLAGHQAKIPQLPVGTDRVVIEAGWRIGGDVPVSPYSAFVIHSHQPGGEMTLIRALPMP